MADEEILGKFQWDGYDLPEDCTKRMGAHGFTEYAFYQSLERDLRAFSFSCCGERTLISRRKSAGGYWRELAEVKHNDVMTCPYCGQPVLAKCLGRLRGGEGGDFPTLRERRNITILDADGDTLLITAGNLYRRWLTGEMEFAGWPGEAELRCPWPESETWINSLKRYAIKPGKVRAWRKHEIWEYGHLVGHDWEPVKHTGLRPFLGWNIMNQDKEDGLYTTIGTDAMAKTDLKYCAIDQYLAEDGREWEDGVYGRDVVGYLLSAARHPQVEMLTKLGHSDVLDDLILRDNANSQLLNWRAKRPNEFFRLTKVEYKAFQAANGRLEELEQWQTIAKTGVTVAEYFTEKKRLTGHMGVKHSIVTCAELAQVCGVSLHAAVSYALKQRDIGAWKDYIAAAKKLGYDLTRQDVSMPKDLQARHNQAVSAAYLMDHREVETKYVKTRLPALQRKYCFTFDGLTIIVPRGVAEIIAEGKAMQHCVGGYADRHIQGKTTILFLRREEDPETPFVTIEMNGKHLVQARGYRNDWDISSTPQTRHPEFFVAWLAWVQAGSPRMANGTPIIQKSDKEGKTA